MDQLRKVLEDANFFAPDDQHGQLVPDSSTQTVSITVGERIKTVKLLLMNWICQSPEKFAEPSRAVRITQLLSSLYDDPQALNSASYDQKILDAAR